MSDPVTIAGGGLAGLSLAAGLLMRGVPVTVHEAGSYPRHRVCGEFVSGIRAETLEALGMESCLQGALPRRTVQWWQQGRPLREYVLPEPALALSRFQLDRRICERVRALGGEVIEHSRQSRQAAGAGEGRVWAAGRVPRKGRWIGLKCHVRSGLEPAADLEMHLGANGYFGVTGVEEGRTNVCGLFRLHPSLAGRGKALLLSCLHAGGHHEFAQRLEAADVDADSFCAVAGFRLGWQRLPSVQCVIGDAEAMIPPFTGNGMSMAFQSAEAALEPLREWSEGRLSWSACRAAVSGRLRALFRKRMTVSQSVHPFLARPLPQHAVASLARLGLLPVQRLLPLIR